MKKITIYLSEKHEKMIDEKIESGRYDSPSQIVCDGLELLREQDLLAEIRINELRKEVQKGIDQIREGKYTTYVSGEDFAEKMIAQFTKERDEVENGE